MFTYIRDRDSNTDWDIDLHVHTSLSDGHTTPIESILYAVESNLKTIVITDHNCIHDQFFNLQEYAKSKGLTIPFAGVEVNTIYRVPNVGTEYKFHLLCYGNGVLDQGFQDYILTNNDQPNDYIFGKYNELTNLGINLPPLQEFEMIDAEDPELSTRKKLFSKNQLAYIVADATKKSSEEVKSQYFKGFKQIKRSFNNNLDIKEVIRKANELGCVTMIAHPLRKFIKYGRDVRLFEDVIRDLIDAGLDGIEIGHKYNAPHYNYLTDLAEKYNLLTSGGSDYHGEQKDWYGGYGSSQEELDRIINRLEEKNDRL